MTAANEPDHPQVHMLATQVQDVTSDAVEVASVDQTQTGEHAVQEAVAHSLHLEVARLPEAREGFVLMP